MLKEVADYVKYGPSCQVHKSSTQKPAGPLRPLPIPSHPWQVVTLDFIMSLPATKHGHTAILVVVDTLAKMTHLIPTTVHATGEEAAKLYINHVFKHHGVPEAIFSDRDPRFTGHFMTTNETPLGRARAIPRLVLIIGIVGTDRRVFTLDLDHQSHSGGIYVYISEYPPFTLPGDYSLSVDS